MTPTHPCVVGIACFAILGCVTVAQALVTLEVTEGNSTCIKAELSASFSITYDTANGTRTVMVPLPGSAVVGGASSCGGDGRSPWLVALFGDGHTLGLSFSSNNSLYSVSNLTLQYNLSDVTTFPEANSTDVVTVETTSVGMVARVNTTYRCISVSPVIVGGATVTFSNVKMEAYMTGDDLSPNESVCTADQNSPTAPLHPPSTTTAAPVPVPTPGTPNQGSYSVSNSNGTVCLLARMALQLNISHFSALQNKTIQEVVNLLPNQTTSSGSCDPSSATLVLTQGGTTNLSFLFTLNTTSNRYHLSGLSVVAAWSDMTAPFNTSNSSLDYLRGSLGRSYMCSSEQTLAVDQNFSLNTFQLQVQPFGLTRGQFAQAEECQLDQDNMLIPIVVGAALAGLVLIVLIAYLIGRKRRPAGYQTI
ncbi:LOW QUALITY PROTEIN: lysosome-associated membrane glycoprotein 1 [Coregonus clupeaformis]|uniref:LOW QUALITY PROTEIN: lysosome-associated membrane glycoprotein 1 n=1 Tax=Coregonus clupeaformis TaxID=59861 RepID=UPI001E1C6A37|nr:LOW QUALITY PROTEIN: lysosome-associated membrane glycoprotein 1 [Coregonus clupeaformis]